MRAQPETGRRELMLFPGRINKGSFTLYEDDGLSMNYTRGEYTLLECALESDSKQITLHIEQSGNCTLPCSTIQILLPQGEVRPLRSNLPLLENGLNDGRRSFTVDLAHGGGRS
jgi:hypothetical protein